MTPEMQKYFRSIEKALGVKMYFYGSVRRYDYFPEDSDVDVDIFAENVDSTVFQLKNYFHKKKAKKVMTFIKGRVVHGYKFSYFEEKMKLKCEYSVYPTWAKHLVLEEHMKKTNIPWYGIILLVLLKTMFYSLNWLDLNSYKDTKKFILSSVIGYKDPPFLIFN